MIRPGTSTLHRSLREGLDLLEIRVSNLQRSFGIEKIPSIDRIEDDLLDRIGELLGHIHLDDTPTPTVLLAEAVALLAERQTERAAAQLAALGES